GRTAAPNAHVHRCGAGGAAERPGRAARRARARRRGHARAMPGRHPAAGRRPRRVDTDRGAVAGEPAADPGGTVPAPLPGCAMTQALLGAGELVKLALRRDRIMIPVWVYALTATAASTAYSFTHLYDTPRSRLDFAASVTSNGSTLAMYGPVHNPSTIGG